MKVLEITGAPLVLRRLQAYNKRQERGCAQGLKKAGLMIKRESDLIIPVQLGHLRGSGFIRNVGSSGFRTDIVVGYTAEYAVYVHENLDAAHGKEFNVRHAQEIASAKGTKRGTAAGGMFNRGEGQQAKFLERPAREKRYEALRIIRTEMKY